jgi:hypothetical protein
MKGSGKFFMRKDVLAIAMLMILYYLIMELYYFYFVGISYEKFTFRLNIQIEKYIETKILFALFIGYSFFIAKKSEFIFAIYIFIGILFFVPSLVTYSMGNQMASPTYCICALMFSIGAFSTYQIRIPEVRSIKFSNSVALLLVFLCLVPIVISLGFSFDFGNFVFSNISETRASFDENASGIINYLYNWLIKAIVPVVIVFFLINNRKKYALIVVCCMLYLYLVSGNKIVFISLFIIFFFSLYGHDHIQKTKKFVTALIAVLIILPVIDFYILNSHALKGLFVMRTLYLPAQLNYNYFDFFNGRPLFFAESNLFKYFVDYPYDKPVGFLISERYFHAFDMNSNNGIISDGYMNLGYFGIVINVAIVSLLFLFFNSLNIHPSYLGVFFLMTFLFLSTPMLSMIITSGIWLIAYMSITFMRRQRQLS